MSWSKFNDSLNSLKGQLTTFIQDNVVLEDGDDISSETQLQVIKERNEQLNSLCANQEKEILTLRAKINELQVESKSLDDNKLIQKSNHVPGTSATLDVQVEEDSWFWEPEKNHSSSSSSKTGEVVISKSGSGADLTLIPLSGPPEPNEVEKLLHRLEDREQQLKKANIENALLSEQVKQLQHENREVNENIEELDKQHSVIVDNLLAQKADFQEKTAQLLHDLKAVSDESNKSHAEKDAQMIVLTSQLRDIEENFKAAVVEIETLKEKLEEYATLSDCSEKLKAPTGQENLTNIEELHRKFEETVADKHLTEQILEDSQNRISEIEIELEKSKEDLNKVSQENEVFIKAQLNYGKVIQTIQKSFDIHIDPLNEASVSNGINQFEKWSELTIQLKQLKEQLNDRENLLRSKKEELEKIAHSKETLQADLVNYEIECGELMKINEKLMEDLEKARCGKLETIPEHSEESMVMLERQLEETASLNKSLKNDFKIMNDRNAELEEQNDLLNISHNSIDEELQLRKKEVEELKSSVLILEDEKSHLTFQLNELQSVEAEHDHSAKKIISLEKQLQAMKDDHDKLLNDIQGLKVELAEKERTVQVLETTGQQETEENLTLMKEEVAMKDQEIDRLRNQMQLISGEINLLLPNSHNEMEKVEDVNFEQLFMDLKTVFGSKEDRIANLELNLKELVDEKNNLIGLITAKHQESLQYHAEVQRLSGILQIEMEKSKSGCEKCVQQMEELTALQMKAEKMSELEKQVDQIEFLREKSDILTSNLLVEQNLKKLLQKEKSDLEEANDFLSKDLDRLRAHLLSLEEEHTVVATDLQKQLEEYKAKAMALEQEAKQASTAYTSASIRANQHTETLQAQYKVLCQQRDELSSKLSAAEDKESKNQAALINLQCALEQFQREKDRDIENALYLVRKEIGEEKERYQLLQRDLDKTQSQLNEAKAALLAAARISDQLEITQITQNQQKEEIDKLLRRCQKAEERNSAIESNQADKVEKSLIKNLLIGYISAPLNDKTQIMKLMSAVLDFSQAESERIGLNKSASGWLGSLLQSGPHTGTNSDKFNNEGLAQAFVHFLEKESQPQPTGLLTIAHETKVETTPNAASSSSSNPAMPTYDHMQHSFAPARNSSTILKDVLNNDT